MILMDYVDHYCQGCCCRPLRLEIHPDRLMDWMTYGMFGTKMDGDVLYSVWKTWKKYRELQASCYYSSHYLE